MDELQEALPKDVFDAIQHHLARAGRRAEGGFESSEEDEDTVTGDLFAHLRRRWSKRLYDADGEWQWRVVTRKFRGRGEGALEHIIGADGIVQVEVSNGRSLIRKGMLFQAKKGWEHRDGRLVEQVRKMEQYAPGGSAVFNYDSDGYTAIPGTSVLDSSGRPLAIKAQRLGDYLANDLLGCIVGRFDTYFDWGTKGLIIGSSQLWFTPLRPRFVASVQIAQQGGVTRF